MDNPWSSCKAITKPFLDTTWRPMLGFTLESGKQPLPHPLPPLSSASQSGEDLAHEALVKTLLDHFVLSKVWHLGQTKNSSGGLSYEVIVLWRCSITFWLWLCISETPSAVGTIQARCQVQCHGSVSVVPEWGLGEVGIYMYLSSSIA